VDASIDLNGGELAGADLSGANLSNPRPVLLLEDSNEDSNEARR